MTKVTTVVFKDKNPSKRKTGKLKRIEDLEIASVETEEFRYVLIGGQT